MRIGLLWLWLISIVGKGEASALFNFPACSDCSSREDVPCQIERINGRCYHTEFRDKWPGKPTDLMSKEIAIESGRTSANFTWKPPYDASVESLSGFFLTVNIVLPQWMGSLGPFCFHANLSGTDWSTIEDPHSVLFHFDCVTTTASKEMHVSLDVSSSPMPNKTPGFLESRAVIGRYKKPEIEPLKINYTVIGTTVLVKFGPLIPRVKRHKVCLSPCKQGFTNCFDQKTISESDGQEVVFTGVKPDNYTVLIQRNIESIYYRTNCFLVAVPPPKAQNSPLVLLIIILGCLLFVVIATTMMFFLLRRYRVLPSCVESCKKKGQYEPTSQNIPNNTTDTPEDDLQELWFLFSTKQPTFVMVAEKLGNIVNKFTQSRVDIHSTMCQSDEEIETKLNEFNKQKVVIILSEDTKNQLESIHNDTTESEEMMSIQGRFLSKIFTRLFSRQSQDQCLVSVCSVTLFSKRFEDIQTYQLINTDKGMDSLQINLKEMRDFLNSLNPIENDVPVDLSDNQDVKEFLISVRHYMEEPTLTSVSDHGYQSGSFEEFHSNSQNRTAVSFPVELGSQLPSLRPTFEREEDTKQWINSQSIPPVCNFMHPNRVPVVASHYQPMPMSYFDNGEGHLRVKVTSQNPHSYPVYPRSECRNQSRAQRTCVHNGGKDQHPTPDIDWEGPDSDSESVTMSTILQQGVELNKNYMVNVKEC